MVAAHSPLRYPGGKACLLGTVVDIIKANRLERRHYAEPYAGGCGLALALLYGGHVSDIHINDVDQGIWSFWHCVLNQTDEFIAKIAETSVTIETWRLQKEVIKTPERFTELELGFATFFLNRTNRSGIIKGGGAIGGLNQLGAYKLDCRFNKDELVRRISRIRRYRNRINLYNLDALDFLSLLQDHLPKETFMCIDPPYYNQGSSLYTSFYKPDDHAKLCEAIMELDRPWILTYDNVPEIKALYMKRRQFEFDLKYSVQTKRTGTEVMIASKGLRMPKYMRQKQSNSVVSIAA